MIQDKAKNTMEGVDNKLKKKEPLPIIIDGLILHQFLFKKI